MTKPDEAAVDALLAMIGPEMSRLVAASIESCRRIIAEELPLCARDAALVDQFLKGAAEVHREEARK